DDGHRLAIRRRGLHLAISQRRCLSLSRRRERIWLQSPSETWRLFSLAVPSFRIGAAQKGVRNWLDPRCQPHPSDPRGKRQKAVLNRGLAKISNPGGFWGEGLP